MEQNKNIESTTLEELFSQDTDGCIPVLMDIQHDSIVWSDNSQEQENGHLRIVNNSIPVYFEGKKYSPAYFSFELPSEDGKTIGNSTVTISAIDQRVIEVIRSITENPKAVITAAFSKISDTEIIFSKLYRYEFEMGSVTWDGVSAKWGLTFDPAMGRNIPADLASKARCPAAYEQNS